MFFPVCSQPADCGVWRRWKVRDPPPKTQTWAIRNNNRLCDSWGQTSRTIHVNIHKPQRTSWWLKVSVVGLKTFHRRLIVSDSSSWTRGNLHRHRAGFQCVNVGGVKASGPCLWLKWLFVTDHTHTYAHKHNPTSVGRNVSALVTGWFPHWLTDRHVRQQQELDYKSVIENEMEILNNLLLVSLLRTKYKSRVFSLTIRYNTTLICFICCVPRQGLSSTWLETFTDTDLVHAWKRRHAGPFF